MRIFLLLALLLCLAACSNNNDNDVPLLEQPPYSEITDSIRQQPNVPDLYFRRAGLLYSQQQTVLAELDLRKAWSISPKEGYALTLTSLLKQRSMDSAILFLKEAVTKIPASIPLQISLARGYQATNHRDLALGISEHLLELYPGQPEVLQLKSELLSGEKKDADALTALEEAYHNAPGDPKIAEQLAFAYADSKNPKALTISDSLIKADVSKRHAEPFYFKGLYYENTGNTAMAIKFFDEAIAHNYHFLDAYMDKGQVYFNTRNYTQALKTFNLAATIDPTYADAWLWLGKTQEAVKNKEEALLNYQRALGLDTSIQTAREGIARLGGK